MNECVCPSWNRRGGCANQIVRRRRRGGQAGVHRAQRSAMSDCKHGIYNVLSKEERRKELRNSPTASESVLWRHLKNRGLNGKKFRRQSSVGPYIVDFFCPEKRVVVELDGAPHFTEDAVEYDARRTRYLEERGIRVVRIENKRVYRDMEGVLEEIRDKLNEDGS
jgi:very-short-patch-repair endonuclease